MTASAVQPTPEALTDGPDWVTASAVQPTFLDSDSFNILSAIVASWRLIGAALAEGGSVWDVAVQPSPGLPKVDSFFLCLE